MSAYLKGWSVWHHGRSVADATEYRAPDLSIRTSDFFAGHMDGPRIIDNGIEPLNASLKIKGAGAANFLAIGSRPFFSSRFVIREGYVDERNKFSGVVDEIEGFISKVSQDPNSENSRAGKSTTIDISLRFYKRTIDGMEKVLLIPEEGVRKINGVDSLNVISALVYLSSISGGVNGVDFKKLKISDFIGGGF
ncbi:phage major tail tube protein [Buttiauxella brennerae]|uniref:phage major tail tube protein n=1 Tax=Buttiauxella brennerae TaxID=82988 RepID=UPI00286F1270|nr:phage major tail tube protein [Buttiauxella brennerae]